MSTIQTTILPAASPVAPAAAAGRPTTRPFTFGIRVYYEDTDAGGVVYYANYLKFFERARTEWLRAAGIEQRRLSDEFGLQFVVADLHCEYRRPARLDDALTVDLRVQRIGRASIVFAQTAWRGADALAHATVKVGCVDVRRLAPAPMPAVLLDAFRTLPGLSHTPDAR